MRPTQTLTSAIVCLVIAAGVAAAQPSSAPSAAAPLAVSRADLTRALLRFDRAYSSSSVPEVRRAEIHRAFDRAAMLWFTGQLPEAIRTLDELAASLELADHRPSCQLLIRALQVRLWPPVARSDRPSILRIRVTPMYRIELDAPVELRLMIRSDTPGSQPILDLPVRIEPDGPAVGLTLAQPKAAMGKYLVELMGPDGALHPAGRWSLVEVPLDVARLNNDRRLRELRPSSSQMRHALVAALARNTLLSDRIDENNSAQYLSDPIQLAREVQSEVEWITMGKDPYAERTGDYWRAILAGGMHLPARVYVPPAVQQPANRQCRLALVIALHGAGGDESTFMQTFGDGQIKKLADEHGFLVVSPNTNWIRPNAAALDAIIEAMSYIHPVDPSRVYLIGHSQGAEVACEIASRQPQTVAAMVLFAGGELSRAARLPPTLVFAGQMDTIAPPQRLQAEVTAARQAGLPVELRQNPAAGHMLLVNDMLPDAIAWLLNRRAPQR